jgi:opacity protein-like surface antigen
MTSTSRILSLTTAAAAVGCITAFAGVQQPSMRSDTTSGAATTTTGEGPYIRIDAGVSFISNADVKLDLPLGAGLSGKVKFKPGFAYGGAVGYRVEEVAFEIELDNTHNKFKSGPGDGPWTDSFRQTTLMGNVIWAPTYEGVTLWIGAGLGAQFQDTNISDSSSPSSAVTGGSLASNFSKKSDTAFIGQIKAGVSVPLDDRWSFDAGYKLRFVGTSDLGQSDISFIPTAGPTENYSAKLKLESHLSHILSAGFTYRF